MFLLSDPPFCFILILVCILLSFIIIRKQRNIRRELENAIKERERKSNIYFGNEYNNDSFGNLLHAEKKIEYLKKKEPFFFEAIHFTTTHNNEKTPPIAMEIKNLHS